MVLLCSLNGASLAEAAQRYAQQDIAVFPLVPRGKEPAVAGGFYSATTDPQVIAHWWSQTPGANIGIATGRNHWCVLDVDPRHHGLTSLEALERDLGKRGSATSVRETLWQLTGGGGLHLIFQLPEQALFCSGSTLPGYPGIDLKKQGGYIVAPPSIHPNGCVYEWQRECLPAVFSAALLDLIFGQRFQQRLARQTRPTRQSQYHTAWSDMDRVYDPEYWLSVSLRKATPGTRHNYALFLAIQLVQIVECSFEEAEHWMHEYATRVAQSPHDVYELEDALECLAYAWKGYAC